MLKEKRKVYIDLLRIIAAGLVIYNHQPAINLFGHSEGIKQIGYLIISIFTKINVPLFLLISGALLLGKDDDYRSVFKKRIPRFLLVILIFNLGLFIITIIKEGTTLSLGLLILEFINQLLSNAVNGTTAYWYLYAYLGFLLILPVLQKIAKSMDKSLYLLLIIIKAITSLISMCNLLLMNTNIQINITGSLSFPLLTDIIFYPLIGYYIDNVVNINGFNNNEKCKLTILLSLSFILTGICVCFEGEMTKDYTHNYLSLFCYVIAICIFIVVKYLFSKKDSYTKLDMIINKLGSLTFGIYLLDPYLVYL